MASGELDGESCNEADILLAESDAVHREIQGYKAQLKRAWLIVVTQWIILAALSTILIITLVNIRHSKHYWIPNEIYCRISNAYFH